MKRTNTLFAAGSKGTSALPCTKTANVGVSPAFKGAGGVTRGATSMAVRTQ